MKSTTPLTNEQRKTLASKRILLEVSPFEAEFIKEMRKYSHGRVTAVILDGVPYRMELGVSYMLFEETDGLDTLREVNKIKP